MTNENFGLCRKYLKNVNVLTTKLYFLHLWWHVLTVSSNKRTLSVLDHFFIATVSYTVLWIKWGIIKGGGHNGKRKPSKSVEKKSVGRGPRVFSARDTCKGQHAQEKHTICKYGRRFV